MVAQSYWIDSVTLWIYVLVLGAIALRVLYRFFTSATRKSSRKSEAADPGSSSGAMVDNDHGCRNFGDADVGGGGDGGGGGGGD